MSALRRIPCLLLALLPAISAAASARAAESYLNVIPSTALAWGAVNHIGPAAEKVQSLAKTMQIPAPSLLETIKKESGLEKGLDENGAAGFFVVPGKSNKEPVAGFFVAVTNEKDFLDNFAAVKQDKVIRDVKLKSPHGEMPHVLAFRHGYAILAERYDRTALEAVIESKQSIAAEMAGYEAWLVENDASIVGTAAGIKYAARQMHDELKKSPDASEVAPGPELFFAKNMPAYFAKGMETASNEISLAMAGVRCDKQGAIRVIGRARLVKDGSFSKAIAQLPRPDERLFGDVPGGPFAFAVAGINVPGLMEAYVHFYGDMMKSMKILGGNSDDEMSRLTKESLAAAGEIRSMNFVMKLGKRSDPIYSNIFATLRVQNSEQVLALQEKSAAAANKILQGAKQPMLKSMEAKRLQVAGKPALQMEISFDFSSLPGGEANQAMLDLMFGPGGKMLTYNVAADEHTILMGVGVPQERMVAALDARKQPKKSLAEDPAIAATSAMLPADSQWVAYVSFRGYWQMIARAMTAAMKNTPGADAFVPPTFPKSPPLGVAVKATPDELRAEIAVPAPLVDATGDFVKQWQKMMENMMMERRQPPAP